MNPIEARQLTKRLSEDSEVLREPPGGGPGYWAGAPGLFYDSREQAYYLTYRLRRPRGIEPDRGGETRIARSEDGRNFEDIFALRKEEIGTPSIERTALFRSDDGRWTWLVSYVDPADNRWCVARVVVETIDDIKADRLDMVFRASDLGLEGIKDPFVWFENGCYNLLVSVALPTDATSTKSHSTADIYTTGQCVSATGLALSDDGVRWTWEGVVFRQESTGWDRYCRRINSVIRSESGYLAPYDGIPDHTQNYEEKTGWAWSEDLQQWEVLTPAKPALTSPHASGSLRYLTMLESGGQLLACYETAREDGAHELRLACWDRQT